MVPVDTALLSARERAVLRLVYRGLQTGEIARELDRSPNTIENQIASARRKLGGVTRRQAARLLVDAEDGGSTTNRPFAIPDLVTAADRSLRQFETVREERAVFVADPPNRPFDRLEPRQPDQRNDKLTTITMIVATTVGILIILVATPSLIESFKAFTAWIIRTFY